MAEVEGNALISQLFIGFALIAASVIVQVVFVGVVAYCFGHFSNWLTRPPAAVKVPVGLAVVALWLMAAHGVAIWMWAVAFRAVGAFTDWETALYFSVVCFTTLGFGDIVPERDWRILSGLCAGNGLLTFGISTAFLVELLRRMWIVTHNGDEW